MACGSSSRIPQSDIHNREVRNPKSAFRNRQSRARQRLCVAYFLYFVALGLYVPYFPAYLAARGFDEVAIGWVLALNPLSRMLVPPLVGLISDQTNSARRTSMIVAWGAVAGLCITAFSRQSFTLVTGALIYFTFTAPLIPLLDTAALASTSDVGSDTKTVTRNRYGYVRLWGSIGFLLSSLGLGYAYPQLPLHLIAFSLVAAHLIFAVFVSLPFDESRQLNRQTSTTVLSPPHESFERRRWDWWRDLAFVVLPARMWWLLLALFLNRVASSPFNGFYTLFVRELELTGEVVAASWGIGVAAEIVMMLFVDRLITRYGFTFVLSCGVLLEALRWFALAFAETPLALLLIAPTHGIAFTMLYVASVRGLAEILPLERRALGQGLGAAATACGTLAGLIGSGYLHHALGNRGMFLVAAFIGIVTTLTTLLVRRFA